MPKIGRNDPCPCGSGKKYKKCCLDKDGHAAASPTNGEATEPGGANGLSGKTPEEPWEEDEGSDKGSDEGSDEEAREEEDEEEDEEGDVQGSISDLMDTAPRELEEMVGEVGLEVGVEEIKTLARDGRFETARQLVEHVLATNPSDDGLDLAGAIGVVAVIWGRETPDRPPLEQIAFEINDADRPPMEDEIESPWTRSQRAWKHLSQALAGRVSAVEEIVSALPGVESPVQWIKRAVGMGTRRGSGPSKSPPCSEVAEFCRSVKSFLPGSPPFFLNALAACEAACLLEAGRDEEADAVFESLLAAGANPVDVRAVWGDIYAPQGMPTAPWATAPWATAPGRPPDIARARKIWEAGLGHGMRSRALLMPRLTGLERIEAEPGPPDRSYLDDADIKALLECGKWVPPEVVLRLFERGPAIVPLLNLLMNDAAWLAPGKDEPRYKERNLRWEWAPSHTAFLAAQFRNPSSLGPMFEVARVERGNEWLYDGMLWFPTHFPAECMDAFIDFALDETQDWYLRAGALNGIVLAAGKNPALREKVAKVFAEALACDVFDTSDVTSSMAVAAARIDSDDVRAAISAAHRRGAVEPDYAGDLEHLLAQPRDWYLGERLPLLNTVEYFNEMRPRSRRGSGPWGGQQDSGTARVKARRDKERKARKSRKKNRGR